MDLKELTQVVPSKWRVQSFSKNKPIAICVAYIDARQVMDLLDKVCGCQNWQSDYKMIDDGLYGGIGIFCNSQWVWKWDTGVESKEDPSKGEASDAFKRAAVKWGVGRFLYSMGIQYVDSNEEKTKTNYPYAIDKNSKRIYDLTKHINGLSSRRANQPTPPSPPVDDKPKKPKEYKNFKFLEAMKGYKKDFGEEEYRLIIKSHGYAKSSHVPPDKMRGVSDDFKAKLEILKQEGGR